MAGLARFMAPGVPRHAARRGNGRRRAFFHDGDDAFTAICLAPSAEPARSLPHARLSGRGDGATSAAGEGTMARGTGRAARNVSGGPRPAPGRPRGGGAFTGSIEALVGRRIMAGNIDPQ